MLVFSLWCMQGCGRGDLRKRDHLEHLGLGGKTMLKWILNKGDEETWTGFIWLRIWTGGEHF